MHKNRKKEVMALSNAFHFLRFLRLFAAMTF
jgi:hypothetical protein